MTKIEYPTIQVDTEPLQSALLRESKRMESQPMEAQILISKLLGMIEDSLAHVERQQELIEDFWKMVQLVYAESRRGSDGQ